MTVSLHRKPAAATAQVVSIRSHTLAADMSIDEGGGDEGPSPHELYDAALGACKALTVLWYARKKGFAVDEVQTLVTSDNTGERTGTYRINAALQIRGALSDAEFAQLRAAAEKCPVHKLMTQVTTEITTTVERAP